MKAVPFLAAIVCSATFIATAAQQAAPVVNRDSIATLVSRLDLERYKATIKGLTQFGDRRQGTARNRAAMDWIETQLKSYGCTNTARVAYEYGAEPVHSVAPAAVNASTAPHFNVGGAR